VSDVTSPWWSDDDELLAAVGDALEAARAVPRDFVEAGKATYSWRDIDAELAALTYDSALDQRPVRAMTRAEPATLRSLTFTSTSARLTIEIEVTDDALLGQIVPPQPGGLEVHTADGRSGTAAIDQLGYFAVRPIPSGSFRLYCRTADANVLTAWITL
jgi:hypothetical protein